MTGLRSLGLVFGAAVALPACIIDTGLGETADDGGGVEASGSDGASDSLDPSATSGPPPTATSGSSSMTSGETGDPTATDGPETETDGEPGCEPGDAWVSWAEDFVEPVPGVEASFAAVLEGPCSLASVFSGSADGVTFEWEIHLSCTMSGRIDGDAGLVDQDVSPMLRGSSAQPLESWLPFFETDLRLRLVLDWWGMGWNRYAVLHRGDVLVLDLVSGERVDPRQGPLWVEDIDALLGDEPWHDGIAVGVVESTCGSSVGECGESPRAIDLSWEGSGTVLHAGQQGGFGTAVPELSYDAAVEGASDISEPTCSDTPLGDYRLALWAVEP
ncbi:MAG: hypothetical protein H6712_13150 [Myxococcales bacterium]|nr:hypothetical protein [Myxococcales bacterium]